MTLFCMMKLHNYVHNIYTESKYITHSINIAIIVSMYEFSYIVSFVYIKNTMLCFTCMYYYLYEFVRVSQQKHAGDLAYSVAGPHLWNGLSSNVLTVDHMDRPVQKQT